MTFLIISRRIIFKTMNFTKVQKKYIFLSEKENFSWGSVLLYKVQEKRFFANFFERERNNWAL